jgi:hypothetical protein
MTSKNSGQEEISLKVTAGNYFTTVAYLVPPNSFNSLFVTYSLIEENVEAHMVSLDICTHL